jgi:hypothetical protein
VGEPSRFDQAMKLLDADAEDRIQGIDRFHPVNAGPSPCPGTGGYQISATRALWSRPSCCRQLSRRTPSQTIPDPSPEFSDSMWLISGHPRGVVEGLDPKQVRLPVAGFLQVLIALSRVSRQAAGCQRRLRPGDGPAELRCPGRLFSGFVATYGWQTTRHWPAYWRLRAAGPGLRPCTPGRSALAQVRQVAGGSTRASRRSMSPCASGARAWWSDPATAWSSCAGLSRPAGPPLSFGVGSTSCSNGERCSHPAGLARRRDPLRERQLGSALRAPGVDDRRRGALPGLRSVLA